MKEGAVRPQLSLIGALGVISPDKHTRCPCVPANGRGKQILICLRKKKPASTCHRSTLCQTSSVLSAERSAALFAICIIINNPGGVTSSLHDNVLFMRIIDAAPLSLSLSPQRLKMSDSCDCGSLAHCPDAIPAGARLPVPESRGDGGWRTKGRCDKTLFPFDGAGD